MKATQAIFLTLTSFVMSIAAQTGDVTSYVPDLVGQFLAISERPQALGLHINGTPNPSLCRHYQGAVRVNGQDGTPFLILTRSGNTPPTPGDDELNCDDSPGETRNGHLIVFRMGSRDKNGERLRSNRLRKGVHVDSTLPNVDDKASIFYTVVDGGLALGDAGHGLVPRVYQHPGGMQVVGSILALAVETPRGTGPPVDCIQCSLNQTPAACARCFGYERAASPTAVMFFDVTDPENPSFKSQFPLVDQNGDPLAVAGLVGFTRLPDNHYLMVVTGGANNPALYFYRSNSTDLASGWSFHDSWHADLKRFTQDFVLCDADSVTGANRFCLSPDEQYLEQNWPDGNDGFTHQTLQFLRQGDKDGTLYLAGARGKPLSNTSTLDLYRVDFVTGEIKLKRIVTRDVEPFPNTGGNAQLVSLAAASTFYVSPSGELLFYATEHDNDGPSGTVKMGEWRHEDIVRDGSPTYHPTARPDGPYEIDEGGAIALSGTAESPITRAWFQFYHETGYQSFNPIVDYADYDRDDFNNFFGLEFQLFLSPQNQLVEFRHNDKARSWKWFAPVGCSIDTIDLQAGGPAVRTLTGTGAVVSNPDLASILTDRGLDAVDFQPDCDTYYNTPLSLQWDLDVNGSFETLGSPVTFHALAFDGPSDVDVPARAMHPSGGASGSATAKVTVRNVAPNLSPPTLTDSVGNTINTTAPFVLTGLPVNLAASFGDPGVLDHQTAAINWGDGVVQSNTAFTTFNEAFGDGVGALSHTHAYNVSGTYSLALAVADDDGGSDAEAVIIRVLTPEQAVVEIISLLDNIIAGTPNGNVRRDLEKARASLAGNPDGNNGALDKIRGGNVQAAIAHIDQAIRELRDAQGGGANVAVLTALLEQVKASLALA